VSRVSVYCVEKKDLLIFVGIGAVDCVSEQSGLKRASNNAGHMQRHNRTCDNLNTGHVTHFTGHYSSAGMPKYNVPESAFAIPGE
jgi:hypothetical protein